MKHLNLTSLSSRRILEFGRRVLYIVSEDALGCMKHLNLTSLSSRRNLEFGRRVLYIVSEDAFRMYETPKFDLPEFTPNFGIWSPSTIYSV